MAGDSNSLKVHRCEGCLVPVQIKPLYLLCAGVHLPCCSSSVAKASRRRGKRPGRHDQAPATHNKWRSGQRAGHHGQVPATHNERRRRKRLGRFDQAPATHIERRRWQRLWNLDHVSATQNELCRGHRPGPVPGINDFPLHHKRLAFALFCACLIRQQAE
jgi:hypothetical protein